MVRYLLLLVFSVPLFALLAPSVRMLVDPGPHPEQVEFVANADALKETLRARMKAAEPNTTLSRSQSAAVQECTQLLNDSSNFAAASRTENVHESLFVSGLAEDFRKALARRVLDAKEVRGKYERALQSCKQHEETLATALTNSALRDLQLTEKKVGELVGILDELAVQAEHIDLKDQLEIVRKTWHENCDLLALLTSGKDAPGLLADLESYIVRPHRFAKLDAAVQQIARDRCLAHFSEKLPYDRKVIYVENKNGSPQGEIDVERVLVKVARVDKRLNEDLEIQFLPPASLNEDTVGMLSKESPLATAKNEHFNEHPLRIIPTPKSLAARSYNNAMALLRASPPKEFCARFLQFRDHLGEDKKFESAFSAEWQKIEATTVVVRKCEKLFPR
jgi:hypothetical protein